MLSVDSKLCHFSSATELNCLILGLFGVRDHPGCAIKSYRGLGGMTLLNLFYHSATNTRNLNY